MADDKTYLGDGLFASFDGYQIKLAASDGVTETNVVYARLLLRRHLEPPVLDAFLRYAKQVFERIAGEQFEAENGEDLDAITDAADNNT
jgi:hypothetical protein